VDAASDPTVILSVEGEARNGVDIWPFEGELTISSQRQLPIRDPALPGSNPLCEQRIVTPIRAGFVLPEEGQVVVTVRPEFWFANVRFSEMEPAPNAPGRFRFFDANQGQPSIALYQAMRAAAGPYEVTLQ
jgi:hypothetical protein